MSEQYMQLQQRGASLAEIFLQQGARLMDIQASAARSLLRTHARSCAAIGGPDWSALYGPEAERQFSELLRTSAEQSLNLIRQTNQTFVELQQAINHLIAQQTGELTAQVRTNMQQIGQSVEQSAAEARRTAQQAADAVQQASSVLEGARSKRIAESNQANR
jgi:ribosomal protein S20